MPIELKTTILNLAIGIVNNRKLIVDLTLLVKSNNLIVRNNKSYKIIQLLNFFYKSDINFFYIKIDLL